MSHPLLVESPQTAMALNSMLRDYGGGLLNTLPDPRPGRHRTPSNAPIAFVLLEELESGGSAQALLLRKSDRPVQIITIRGNGVTGGDFNLHYGSPIDVDGDEVSDAITYDATASEAKTALEACESIDPGSVLVHLGETTYLNANGVSTTVILGRWFIEFLKLPDPELLLPFFISGETALTGSPSDVKSETHFLVPTDKQVTIYSAVPTGTPSAMRPGAIGLAEFYHGIGHCVDAIEARHFTVTDPEEVGS